MDDEILSGLASLIGVMDAGVDERLLDAVAVHGNRGMIGVLLHDREQVAEEPALGLCQLCAIDRRAGARILDAIDRRARSCDQR
jgi:hypothetical protein